MPPPSASRVCGRPGSTRDSEWDEEGRHIEDILSEATLLPGARERSRSAWRDCGRKWIAAAGVERGGQEAESGGRSGRKLCVARHWAWFRGDGIRKGEKNLDEDFEEEGEEE